MERPVDIFSPFSRLGKKNVPYWNPNIGQICTFGPFEVLMTSQKEDDCLIERVFDLKSTSKNVYVSVQIDSIDDDVISVPFFFENADRTRIIRQFQMKDSVDRLVIIKRFLKEMRTYSDQNVILQCLYVSKWFPFDPYEMIWSLLFRNGVTWSGYFAALCNSIDKMQTEQIVDPFKIVRLLRSVRPEFIDQVGFPDLVPFASDRSTFFRLESIRKSFSTDV